MRRFGTTLNVPGFPRFAQHRIGTPATIRMLAITVDGAVSVHAVSNEIGYLPDANRWVQWRLVREVSTIIDTEAPNGDFLVARDVIDTPDDGMVVMRRRSTGGHVDQEDNLVASAMLARIGIHRAVRGNVAWLGDVDSDSGMHADLSNYRIDCLRILAAQAHAQVMTALHRSAS